MSKYTREQLAKDIQFLEDNGVTLNQWCDVSDSFYHDEAPGISASGLKTIRLATPSKYIEEKRNGKKEKSEALILGSAIHKYILEKDKFYDEYLFMTEKSTRKGDRHWKIFINENDPDGEKIILRPKVKDMLEGIEASLQKEKFGQNISTYDGIIQNPIASREQALFTVDEDRGIILKIKVDVNLNEIMFDLKSTTNCNVKDFMAKAANLGYGIQAAVYLKTAELAGVPSTKFGFIAIEKEAPYDHSVIIMRDEDVNLEKQALEKLLDEYAYYLFNDVWPGPNGIDRETGKEPLFVVGEMPAWYRYQLEEMNGFEGV
jgi:exodeoxyribonuclease VIII